MYEINSVVTLSQTSIATNMVLMLSTNVFTADQRIAVLEQEIFNLRNAKCTFDGVEILKPVCANKSSPTEQPKVPESTTKLVPPPEKPTTTTQPPVHPFTNVAETSYQPPHECNFAAAPAKPAKEKEPAYHYVALSKTCILSSMSTINRCSHPTSPFRQKNSLPYPLKFVTNSTRLLRQSES
jgi:hypothetical protein